MGGTGRERSRPVCTGLTTWAPLWRLLPAFRPTRFSLGDHWLFPPGWAGGVCPADAHPHPDPRVSSQPAHGVQSTLQSEPKTGEYLLLGCESRLWVHGVGWGGALGVLSHQGPSFLIPFQQVPDQIAEAA